jgi:HlyD family secretion protein
VDPTPARTPSLRRNVIAAVVSISLGFGGFFVWGYTAHLDSAAIASGSIILDSKAKPVSHLEGGILKQMLVEEGQVVHAGDPLVALDDTKARTDLQQLQARRIGFMAKIARLRAEQTGASTIEFPAELTDATDDYSRQIVANERALFDRRRDTLQRTIGAQQKQIDGYIADSNSAAAQLAENTDRQLLLKQQVDAMQILVDKQIAARTQLIDLQSRYSQLLSEASSLMGSKTRAEESRAQVEVEISKTETSWQSDVADALQSTMIDLSAINDNISAAEDVLRRIIVTSPEDGVVTGIQYRTPGGVIAAGQPILSIVPSGGQKIVEAKLNPRDIDAVHTGAKVRIRLTAYDAKQVPMIDGTLIYVAADQTVDQQTSVAYYVVRAAVPEEELSKVTRLTLNAGEPADLLILNRPRLAIDYILSPFIDSMHMAGHEQ